MTSSIALPQGDIDAVAKAREIGADVRVVDGFAGRVEFQIALGDIGADTAAVDEHVIPGLVLGRPAFGAVLVPLRGAEEMGIEVDDHAPGIEQGMQDHVAGG